MMGRAPKPGFDWNPLAKFPRNQKCFCGSSLKFKRCCAENVKPVCPQADADRVNEIVRRFGWDGIAQAHQALREQGMAPEHHT